MICHLKYICQMIQIQRMPSVQCHSTMFRKKTRFPHLPCELISHILFLMADTSDSFTDVIKAYQLVMDLNDKYVAKRILLKNSHILLRVAAVTGKTKYLQPYIDHQLKPKFCKTAFQESLLWRNYHIADWWVSNYTIKYSYPLYKLGVLDRGYEKLATHWRDQGVHIPEVTVVIHQFQAQEPNQTEPTQMDQISSCILVVFCCTVVGVMMYLSFY